MAKAAEKLPATTTSVAVVERGSDLPDYLRDDIATYSGAGTSSASKDNILPWLVVLQKNSPQVNKKDPNYVTGAEAGMVLNRATNKVYDAENEGILVIPAAFSKAIMEWEPRVGGAGGKPPVAMHPETTSLLKQARLNEKQTLVLPNGNELLETAFEIVILVDEQEPAVISMAKSALQASRRWMSLKRSFKVGNPPVVAPSFMRMYRLKTTWVQNDKGDWYNWQAEDAGWVNDSYLYSAAKQLHIAFDNGEVQLGRMEDAEAGGATTGSYPDDGIPI